MNDSHPNFPTSLHQNVAEIVLSYFADLAEVDSVLLLNSCARGQATPQSDLDMAVLVAPDLSEAQQNSLQSSCLFILAQCTWTSLHTPAKCLAALL